MTTHHPEPKRGDVPDQSRLSRAKDGERFDPDEYEQIERRADRILELYL
jgi:hypothetical protein